jgi:hypothetical protein
VKDIDSFPKAFVCSLIVDIKTEDDIKGKCSNKYGVHGYVKNAGKQLQKLDFYHFSNLFLSFNTLVSGTQYVRVGIYKIDVISSRQTSRVFSIGRSLENRNKS